MTSGVGYPGIFSSDMGAAAAMAYPPSYVADLLVSYASASTVQIATGSCRDDSNNENIDVTGVLTADITVTGANGRNVDTAEAASKWYAVEVIKNTGTGAVASFLINQDDLGAFTYPAGYSVKRRVGWIYNDSGSNFRKIIYHGKGMHREAYYDVEQSNLLALNAGNSTVYAAVPCAQWIPPTENLGIFLSEINQAFPNGAYIKPTGSTVTNAPLHLIGVGESNEFPMGTDTSQQVSYKVTNVAIILSLFVLGWKEAV